MTAKTKVKGHKRSNTPKVETEDCPMCGKINGLVRGDKCIRCGLVWIPNRGAKIQKGDIVRLKYPYPDEDPKQLYVVAEETFDDEGDLPDFLISEINSKSHFGNTLRVKPNELFKVSNHI